MMSSEKELWLLPVTKSHLNLLGPKGAKTSLLPFYAISAALIWLHSCCSFRVILLLITGFLTQKWLNYSLNQVYQTWRALGFMLSRNLFKILMVHLVNMKKSLLWLAVLASNNEMTSPEFIKFRFCYCSSSRLVRFYRSPLSALLGAVHMWLSRSQPQTTKQTLTHTHRRISSSSRT